MRIDYLGLEAFVSIAEYGSFRRAAEVLNLSQTALSHRLKKVEEDLGVALLIRTNREVSLTQPGQELLPRARQLLQELRETYTAVRQQGRQNHQTLSFACLPSIANSVLPAAISDFSRSRPEVAIHLHDVAVHMIADRVQSGEAEFGVTIISAQLSNLQVKPLIEEDYNLLVPGDHEFAARGHVERADLVGLPMARITTQSKNRQLVDVALGHYREQIIWRYEVRNGTAAMSLVAAGLAFTILPRSATMMAPAGLVPLPFSDVRPSRTLAVVQRRGLPLSEMASEMLARIERRITDHVRAARLFIEPSRPEPPD